jgi:large subunit ribosomal protein L13e
MVSKNNMVPREHFHKQWQRRVRTWFNQAANKRRRRMHRAVKAQNVFPRPVAGLLRPVVRCPTRRYNMKVREGRGFSVAELKAAKICPEFARTIGIAVDYRRRPRSKESLQLNVARLQTYMKKLMLFPRNAKRVHKGETNPAEFKAIKQVLERTVLPITAAEVPRPPVLEFRDTPLTPKELKFSPYNTIRRALAAKKLTGRAVSQGYKAAKKKASAKASSSEKQAK